MHSSIIDLEELVLKCRNETARMNIQESIKCYYAGAYRSSIISTWLAVFYDVLEKYKELSLLGDDQATKDYDKYQSIFEKNDIQQGLTFERDLVDNIYKKYEFITHSEYVDLLRLREDRNRCAHPRLDLNLEVYMPSAELARSHIRSAVEFLLQYPATAGKQALSIILDSLESSVLKNNKESVLTLISATPIKKLKKSTVNQLLKELTHKITVSKFNAFGKYFWVMEMIDELYPQYAQEFFITKFNPIIRKSTITNDFQLIVLNYALKPKYFSILDEDILKRIEVFIEDMMVNSHSDILVLDKISKAVEIPIVQSWGLARINKLSIDDYKKIGEAEYGGAILNRFIDIFIDSPNYESTQKYFSIYRDISFKWTKIQLQKILDGAYRNSQIYDEGFKKQSKTLNLLVRDLKAESGLSAEEFEVIHLKAIQKD